MHREGVYLAHVNWKDNGRLINELNVEVRTYDNSLNINHVALVRFLTRLLWIRATEISEYGKYMLRNTVEWKEKKNVIRKLNNHDRFSVFGSVYTDEQKNEAKEAVRLMKETSEELYVELQHLMTDTEKNIFKEFVEKPIWLNRDEKLENVGKNRSRRISEFDRALLCIVKTKSIFADSRKQYYRKVAKTLGSTESYVRTRLGKVKAKWNGDVGAYIIK